MPTVNHKHDCSLIPMPRNEIKMQVLAMPPAITLIIKHHLPCQIIVKVAPYGKSQTYMYMNKMAVFIKFLDRPTARKPTPYRSMCGCGSGLAHRHTIIYGHTYDTVTDIHTSPVPRASKSWSAPPPASSAL